MKMIGCVCFKHWYCENINDFRRKILVPNIDGGHTTPARPSNIEIHEIMGTFTLTLSEYLCPSQRPRPWQNCVYTTSEARIRGHSRQWPFLVLMVACSSDHVNRRLWACALHELRRPCPRKLLHVATSSNTDVRGKSLGHRLGSV